MLLKTKDAEGANRAGPPDARPGSHDAPEELRAIVCRACGAEISDVRALFAMRASSVVQVFPNPYGEMRSIMTLSRATGLRLEGPATEEFTWFAGYAWRVAYCGACGAHLGWRYESTRASPPVFFGLLVSAACERAERR